MQMTLFGELLKRLRAAVGGTDAGDRGGGRTDGEGGGADARDATDAGTNTGPTHRTPAPNPAPTADVDRETTPTDDPAGTAPGGDVDAYVDVADMVEAGDDEGDVEGPADDAGDAGQTSPEEYVAADDLLPAAAAGDEDGLDEGAPAGGSPADGEETRGRDGDGPSGPEAGADPDRAASAAGVGTETDAPTAVDPIDDAAVAVETAAPEPADGGGEAAEDGEDDAGVDAPPTLDLDAAFDVDEEFDWVDDPVAADVDADAPSDGPQASDPEEEFAVVTGFEGDRQPAGTAGRDGPDGTDDAAPADGAGPAADPSGERPPGTASADEPLGTDDGWELAGELDPDNVTRVRSAVPEPALPDEPGEAPAIDEQDLDEGTVPSQDRPAGLDPDNVTRGRSAATDEAVARLSEFVYGGGGTGGDDEGPD